MIPDRKESDDPRQDLHKVEYQTQEHRVLRIHQNQEHQDRKTRDRLLAHLMDEDLADPAIDHRVMAALLENHLEDSIS